MIDVSLSLALERPEALRVPSEVQTACASVVVQLHRRSPGVQAIGITSARTREGRSTIAAGVAIAEAQSMGRRTVLLDLDPVRPRPDDEPAAGYELPPVDAEQAIEWVIPELGALSARPWLSAKGVLTRQVASQLISQLRSLDVTIVADLPAVPPNGTGDRFADLLDLMVLVVRAGSTPQDVVQKASDALPTEPLVVLNGARSSIPRWLRGGRT